MGEDTGAISVGKTRMYGLWQVARQRQAVELKNAILRKRVEVGEELHRRALREKLRENQGLLQDTADARREVVTLKRRVAAAELQLAQKVGQCCGTLYYIYASWNNVPCIRVKYAQVVIYLCSHLLIYTLLVVDK